MTWEPPQKMEPSLHADPVDEYDEELKHPAVEAGDVMPVLVRVVAVGKGALRARRRNEAQDNDAPRMPQRFPAFGWADSVRFHDLVDSCLWT